MTLTAETRLSELLSHLYVLIPVLDDGKHYWVGEDEVEKLLAKGEGWLSAHPAKDEITRRYLRHRRSLVRQAMARLLDVAEQDEVAEREHLHREEVLERPLSLNEERLAAVVVALRAAEARSVLDLGCSGGNLLRELLKDPSFERIVGVDASHAALEVAARRLRLDRLPEAKAQRISLLHGALTYRDRRLEGFDAAALVEVVEHVDPDRLPQLERALFECARPRVVVVTTPNVEYNALFEGLEDGVLRHPDHRFEWTREEFSAWCEGVAARFHYDVVLSSIGTEDPVRGAPTQMARFQRKEDA